MGFQKREMVDVRRMNLKCAECGAKIDELPFHPSSDRPVYCRDCARNRKPAGGGGGGNRRDSGQRGRY